VNCPSCSAPLAPSSQSCSACGHRAQPPVLGALAPDLSQLIPARLEAEREIPPPLRKRREPKWQDEVRTRVRERRRQRLGSELPLFAQAGAAVLDVELDADEPSSLPAPRDLLGSEPALQEPELLLRPAAASEDEASDGPRLVWSTPEPEARPTPPAPIVREEAPAPPVERAERWSLGGDETEGAVRPQGHGLLGDPESSYESEPLEYPAPWSDRLQAAVFDLGVLVTLWSVVVYFASRAAHVSAVELRPAGVPLVAYLAFLGLLYAVYFTGTCGRTIGKIVCGLKVVDVAGRAPGYPRAFARVLLGTIGILLGMLGLVPVLFDPARRAVHDRIVRTRVVKY
jgi:uncharacterized RDD family membrane protein YckC